MYIYTHIYTYVYICMYSTFSIVSCTVVLHNRIISESNFARDKECMCVCERESVRLPVIRAEESRSRRRHTNVPDEFRPP